MKKFRLNSSSLKIIISSKLKKELFKYRQVQFDSVEKGGVIMGQLYPKSNKIIITHFLKSKNNYATKYSLELNVKELQEEMNEIWEKSKGTITYLGDWHTHPQISPNPSISDYKTFFKNYYFSKFNQNILLYIILGTDENIWIKSFNGFRFKATTLSIEN